MHNKNRCRFSVRAIWALLEEYPSTYLKISDFEHIRGGYDKLLLSGIGIYQTLAKERSDKIYRNLVTDIANRELLSYIVSDAGIIYGTNLPITKVIVGEIKTGITQDMLHQLIGRAGRTGKANKACVVFTRDTDLYKAFGPKDRGRRFYSWMQK